MKATQLEQGKFQSATFKLSRELGENGAEALIRIDEDDAFRNKVADYILRGAPDQIFTTNGLTRNVAEAIMGKDKVIGPDRIKRELGLTLNEGALLSASQTIHPDHIPYRPETLVRCADSHLLVYGCPTNINHIVRKSEFGIRWKGLNVHDQEPAMLTDLPMNGWFLIGKKVKECVSESERLATVVELFLALSLHKMTNRTHHFFKTSYGRCLETSDGGEVYFGLGQNFLGKYKEGSYDYCVLKEAPKPTENVICVVLPDDPIN